MATFLFSEIIFGPVNSRRLGKSLGINLLPVSRKVCNFDCIYCECGLSNVVKHIPTDLPSPETVLQALELQLLQMKTNGNLPDTLTYAGNGEPTLHPGFLAIVEGTIALRQRLCPEVKIAVLSNATRLDNPMVRQALAQVDLNILKVDSAFETTRKLLNGSHQVTDNGTLIRQLQGFKSNLFVQTLFLKGQFRGLPVDNTTENEILAWMAMIDEIAPRGVMLYTIERDTPESGLLKVDSRVLSEISKRVSRPGREVLVSL